MKNSYQQKRHISIIGFSYYKYSGEAYNIGLNNAVTALLLMCVNYKDRLCGQSFWL
jgi:hypothetical protein